MAISELGAGHVAAAFAALLFGALVLLLRKGTALHRQFGLAYGAAMLAVNLLALLIYRVTGQFGPFHALALVSLFSVLAGIAVAIVRPRRWLTIHYRMMSMSYLGLLAATATEMAIRVPVLQINNPTRGTVFGVASAFVFTGIGAVLLPRLQRRALATLEQEA